MPRFALVVGALLVVAPLCVAPPQPAAPLPDVSVVECATTKGTIKIEVHPAWAPLGAARFLELVQAAFFTDVAL